jgi:hypothetical protein
MCLIVYAELAFVKGVRANVVWMGTKPPHSVYRRVEGGEDCLDAKGRGVFT